MDNSSKVIQETKEWLLTLPKEQQKHEYERIASVDGVDKRDKRAYGQFYITAENAKGAKLKMVVTAAFLDKSREKLSPDGKKLFRVGAPVIWKWSEGHNMANNATRTSRATVEKYMDVKAVFTAAQQVEWEIDGFM
jgi:hypothetical protein